MDRQPEPEVMDVEAEVYAYAQANFAEVNARFVADLLDTAGGLECGRAVDLGCGPGDITLRVAAARPGWAITGVDASDPMLATARAAHAAAGGNPAPVDGMTERITFARADAKSLPFKNSSVNVLFSNSLIHHISDVVPVWREIARVTRPAGVVFVRDLYRPADESAARAIVARHAGGESETLKEEFYRSLLSAYSPDEIAAQLESAGLGHLRIRVINDRHIDIAGRR